MLLCKDKSYQIQVYYSCWNGHQGAVEAVEHTSVSGQDITRILDAECTFHQRFGQVAPRSEYYNRQSQSDPDAGTQECKEVCQHDGSDDAEYSTSDRAFPRLFWGNAFEQSVLSEQHACAISARIITQLKMKIDKGNIGLYCEIPSTAVLW